MMNNYQGQGYYNQQCPNFVNQFGGFTQCPNLSMFNTQYSSLEDDEREYSVSLFKGVGLPLDFYMKWKQSKMSQIAFFE